MLRYTNVCENIWPRPYLTAYCCMEPLPLELLQTARVICARAFTSKLRPMHYLTLDVHDNKLIGECFIVTKLPDFRPS